MSAEAHQLMTAIEALPEAEREAVLTELMYRYQAVGALPDIAFEELAEEVDSQSESGGG
jgi:hypothetical protein